MHCNPLLSNCNKKILILLWKSVFFYSFCLAVYSGKTSVVDPNTLYLDPDPEICPNFDPDPSRFTRLHYQFIL